MDIVINDFENIGKVKKMCIEIKSIAESIITAIIIGSWVKNRDEKQAIINAIAELYFNGPGVGGSHNPFKLDDVYKLSLLKILPNVLQEDVVKYIHDVKQAKNPGQIQQKGPILSKDLEDYLDFKWRYKFFC